MTNPCLDCDLCDKLSECCGSHPETRRFITQTMNTGEVSNTCPSLDSEGFCTLYDERPGICMDYECHKFYSMDLVSRLRF